MRECSAKFVEASQIKILFFHETPLFRGKAAGKEALEGRFLGCPEEERIAR